MEQIDSNQRKEQGGQQWKEDEGISQGMCTNDPWTWATGGAGGGLGGGDQRRKNWDNCSRTIKYLIIK